MLLSELAEKECIEVTNGERVGFLANTECLIDIEKGRVIGFELQTSKLSSLFGGGQSLREPIIYWENIDLIGEDRILFRWSGD